MTELPNYYIAPRDELYNYSYVFPFEAQYSPIPSLVWLQSNWVHSLTFCAIYAIIIYFGRKIMSKRVAFELTNLLTVWNAALAIFSIAGVIRMSPEFIHVVKNYGFQYSVCSPGYMQVNVTAYWTDVFAFSKVFELIDTLFIVLRKRPLIFLHWYHHMSVLVFAWHTYKEYTAAGRWFVWMNFLVHSIMYSYYALRSFGVRFPKWIPMSITFMQIAQMILGCSTAVVAYYTKRSGQYCQQSYENLYCAFAIYFSYFVLFGKFFYDVYLKKNNRYQKVQTGGSVKNEVVNGESIAANGRQKAE